MLDENDTFWRDRLPHWHKAGRELFITMRVAETLPKTVIERFKEIADTPRQMEPHSEAFLAERRRYFATLEKYLDSGNGFCPFYDARAAEILAQEMTDSQEQGWVFQAWAIMPNHLHVLVKAEENAVEMKSFWQTFKGRTARAVNQCLERQGSFWQREWFDHWLRDGEREKVIDYIISNPIKARLPEIW